MAKFDSGKITYKYKRADLKEAVDYTLVELAPLIKAKTLEICTSFSDCTEAHFDEQRIIQVLINLLSNAIKFSGIGRSGSSLKFLKKGLPAAGRRSAAG